MLAALLAILVSVPAPRDIDRVVLEDLCFFDFVDLVVCVDAVDGKRFPHVCWPT